MPDRFTKNKPRTETARFKDISLCLVQETARDPSEGRTEGGRFGPGNRIAVDQGMKAFTRREFGDPTNPEVRDMLRRYRALRRKLPGEDQGVRELVAAQVRNIQKAQAYSRLADEAGLGTPQGMKLAEQARAHDKTAQGLGTASFDRAIKVAGPREAQSAIQKLRARAAKAPKAP